MLLPLLGAILLSAVFGAGSAQAATPCDTALNPNQCGWFDVGSLPPFVHDAIVATGGVPGAGNVLVLSSGDPGDPDTEISNPMGHAGCGTNPDGWQTYDCELLDSFVPPQDSVVLALSAEWFEWYQTYFTDWMTISGAGVPTVDVSINSWVASKATIIPYGPMDTGVVILTSLSAQKMVNFRVADSGDSIYDTALVVVPATWFSAVNGSNSDPTLLCGNGKLEPGEECDDGNNVANDGCSTLCLGAQPPSVTPPAPSATCGNLLYAWPNATTSPYTCGADLCAGFRCVVGNTISPACYTATQCAGACAGSCVDVQTAQLDCKTMCTVQPPANLPPPVLPQTCNKLVYSWPDGTTMPYTCDDTCQGQRCVTGSTISPDCLAPGACDASTCPNGTCVITPAADCNALCAMGDISPTCTPAEKDTTRPAANQKGACLGSIEMCSGAGLWEVADGYYVPVPEICNGIDDDCNGIVDDKFVTCGDPGLCQNTVNTCDPANPGVTLPCVTLPPPSPVEICNNGLDDDCDGAADDGCSCGDHDCMPGENFIDCPQDCPAPANGSACDDGNLCTAGDNWQGGVCVPGAPVNCENGNACMQAGVCDPATGCSATKVNCDDGIACTTDTCDAAAGCVNTPVNFACDDSNPCTTDTCDVASGCLHTPDPTCGGQDADADGYIGVGDGGTDCNDGDPTVHPGAVELCNAIDDDCDGIVDDGYDLGTACQSLANACGTTVGGVNVCTADHSSVECNAVMPPNPVGYGDVCLSLPNDCGTTQPGTIGCTGLCSGITPPNPAGYGDVCASAPNACGETGTGTVTCDGSCNGVAPTPADADNDGTPDCLDTCPADAGKTSPGVCGCGVADVDTNSNGMMDCQETARADVGIALSVLTKTPTGGKRLRIRLEASNAGPDLVSPGATLTGSISGGTLTDLRLPTGCEGTADAFTCTTKELKSGRTKALKIAAVPSAASTVTVSVSITSPVVDPNAVNQSATLLTVIP